MISNSNLGQMQHDATMSVPDHVWSSGRLIVLTPAQMRRVNQLMLKQYTASGIAPSKQDGISKALWVIANP